MYVLWRWNNSTVEHDSTAQLLVFTFGVCFSVHGRKSNVNITRCFTIA
jgi:hypothetical protein